MATEAHLARFRVAEVEGMLAVPNLDKVRHCLVSLIERVEVREDGRAWMLVGEEPLGTDDLRLLPQAEDPEAGNTTTGHERDARNRSLERVVGASRDTTYTRPTLWMVRLAV